MAISKGHPRKEPTQRPTDFYKSQQFGGPRGNQTQSIPQELKGGPMREKINGKADLK